MINRISERTMYALGAVAIVIALGMAGSYDHAEQVVYAMPDAAYKAVKEKVGQEAGVREIASEYLKNRTYYDSMP